MATAWGERIGQGARAIRSAEQAMRDQAAARRESLLMALLTAARSHAVDLRRDGKAWRATAGHVQALRAAIDRAPCSPVKRTGHREELLSAVRVAAVRHMLALERIRPGLYRVDHARLDDLLTAIDAADEAIHGGHGRQPLQEVCDDDHA
jgi:hypothetical protein